MRAAILLLPFLLCHLPLLAVSLIDPVPHMEARMLGCLHGWYFSYSLPNCRSDSFSLALIFVILKRPENFIRPNSINWLPLSVTDSLSGSCLEDLTDVTLAFEYANSKLLDVVSVADVDAMERDDDSLVNILKLRFGRDFEAGVW